MDSGSSSDADLQVRTQNGLLKLVGYAEIEKASGVSRSTIERAWRGTDDDGEPKLSRPGKIGSRSVWAAEAVNQWLHARAGWQSGNLTSLASANVDDLAPEELHDQARTLAAEAHSKRTGRQVDPEKLNLHLTEKLSWQDIAHREMEEHQLLIVYLSELPDDEAMLIVASLLPQLRNHLAKTASPRALETLTGVDPIEIDFRLIGAFLKLFEMQTRLSEIGMREPTHQTVLEQISEFEPGRAFIIAAWLFPALRPAFIEGAETAFYRDLFADPDQLRELATLALNDDEWAEIEPQLFAQQRASQAPFQAASPSDKYYRKEPTQ
ncbi:MAG: putative DNA-binding transcriptional regulator AlpA [Hyphomicrobiaceae bacterium]|jgi:predicted DNA-binding transcriptional regulator AlpA